MTFNNFPLARKLAVGFGAVLGVVALSSAFMVFEVRQVTQIERLTSVSSAVLDDIDQVQGDLAQARSDVHKLLLTGAAADKASAQANLDELKRDLASVRDILDKDAPAFISGLDDYQAKLDSYVEARLGPEISLGSDAATRPKAVTMVTSGESAPYTAAVNSSFNALHDRINTWADGWTEAGRNAMDRILAVVAGSGVVCILVGSLMAWLIMRAIGRPLSAMTITMRRLAEGDNTVTIPALGQTDEVGQMAQTVQVFKQAAVAKVRLEQEAVETRRLSDGDRSRSEAERAAAAREQSRVVQSIATGLERLSDGDLVFRLNEPFAEDYEKLRGDFNAAMAKLQNTMTVVAVNASAIRSGTSEITTASDDLSRRTEQQAASLEETAAALDQITTTVKKTSQGSIHAQQVVSSAKADAEHSGDVVRQAVIAMSAIEKSSQQVSQIIGVIDEIAFQTNLLALNAGVEAARAGDSGRGFAVVASEVRGLAQRSAEAAKEIKALILASSRQVSDGVKLVGETGTALSRIVAQVADINGIVSEISNSTQEQAMALQQVNTAINQMDQVTQQNAAMVEQSTAASHSLAQQTQELAVLIGRFNVVEHGGGPGDAVRPASRERARGTAAPARPAAAMKVVGRGGAQRKVEASPDAESWTEF